MSARVILFLVSIIPFQFAYSEAFGTTDPCSPFPYLLYAIVSS